MIKSKKLNIGSGPVRKGGWISHDTSTSIWYRNVANKLWKNNDSQYSVGTWDKADIDLDLTINEPFPLDANSLEVVLCSHVIEHLLDKHARHLFKDIYRMLENGGVFRICTPDADFLFDKAMNGGDEVLFRFTNQCAEISDPIEQFINAQCSYFCPHTRVIDLDMVDSEIYNQFLNDVPKINKDRFIEILNEYGKYGLFEYFRKLSEEYYDTFSRHLTGFHVNWWNEHKIVYFLFEAGFEKVFTMDNTSSHFNEISNNVEEFSNSEPEISVYLEAIK
jgi:SAM-dependent methyltransferase